MRWEFEKRKFEAQEFEGIGNQRHSEIWEQQKFEGFQNSSALKI